MRGISYQILSLLFLSALVCAVHAQPGILDPTFGNGGKVITDYFNQRNSATSGFAQPDGKIVVGGTATATGSLGNFLLVRYTVSGALDATFGSGGFVLTDHNALSDNLSGLALQSDGKIVAFGSTGGPGVSPMLLAIRYNPDGSLDGSFGSGGQATASWDYPHQQGTAVVIQPDGKIIGVGAASDANFVPAGLCAVRFNSDGTPDNSFGNGGRVIVPFGGTDVGSANAVMLQLDGKMILAGLTDRPNTFRDWALARLNPDGSLDNAFGTGGKVITDLDRSDNFGDAALQRDGKIVVVGTSNTNIELSLARYNPDGTLDTTFGTGGKVISTPAPGENFGDEVSIQPDGKILAAASCGIFPDRDFCVLRYNSNGAIDNSFGTNGMVRTGFTNGSLDNPGEMFLQGDGKIVVCGDTGYDQSPTGSDFATARYLNDSFPAPVHTTFDYDGDGRADPSVYRGSNGAWYLLESTAGFVPVGFGNSTDKIVPADLDGDGKTDVAVFRPSNSTWYWLNSSNGAFNAVQFGASDDLPTPADYDGDGKADVSVFRPSNGVWYRLNSHDGSFYAVQFGASEDKPTIGDFDGDGRADIAVYRPSNGAWYRLNSSNGQFVAVGFGLSTDLVSPADFDGDGKTDTAIYRPSAGTWYWLNSSNGAFNASQFGASDDVPVAADFDGDGKADVSVFRPSNGVWYRLNSSNGSFFAVQFGASGDQPTPAAFRY